MARRSSMRPQDRVSGIGGVFFKASDPEQMASWYQEHLGIKMEPIGPTSDERVGQSQERYAAFQWRHLENPDRVGTTVWAVFPHRTTYFSPGDAPFMIQYRVADLDGVLDALRKEGVLIDEHREDFDYGRFAWIRDPEGNRIELWQPLGE
jgi:predicted enzyme related to lactoylglutathione lyase